LKQFSGSQEAFGTTFRVKGGYRKAGTSFVKKVTGMIFTITVVSDFIESSKTLFWMFFQNASQKF
jgi:hypothetical protein